MRDNIRFIDKFGHIKKQFEEHGAEFLLNDHVKWLIAEIERTCEYTFDQAKGLTEIIDAQTSKIEQLERDLKVALSNKETKP